MMLHSWSSEVQNESHGARINMAAGLHFFPGSRGIICFFARALRGCPVPWLIAPFLYVQSHWLRSFAWSLWFTLFCVPCSLIITLVLPLGPRGGSRIISPSPGQPISTRNSICNLYSYFPRNVTYSEVLGINMGTSLGGHHSTYPRIMIFTLELRKLNAEGWMTSPRS